MLGSTLGWTGELPEGYIDDSGALVVLLVRAAGTVAGANRAALAVLGRTWDEVQGVAAGELLAAQDALRLAAWLSGDAQPEPGAALLNVVDAHHTPRTLRCHVRRVPGGLCVVGEPEGRHEDALPTELLRLNNELAVVSRERARQGRELARALRELRDTQTMLVHREKMASLGQMTAGVAHEINNPLAFVISNSATLDDDLQALFGFVNAVGDALPELRTACPAVHDRLMDAAAAAELAHLAEAMPRKIAVNLDGLHRIKELVLDLRRFSRLDEAELKEVPLSECVDAALRFLGPLCSEREVGLVTELAELPPLLCNPGALNQAITNVVTNAVQASPAGGEVRVRTAARGEGQAVVVEDRGPGIPAEDRHRVCDPFFTTKPVGEGTGLGLSITHRVVAAHGGALTFEDRPGGGTRVIMELTGAVHDPAAPLTAGFAAANKETAA